MRARKVDIVRALHFMRSNGNTLWFDAPPYIPASTRACGYNGQRTCAVCDVAILKTYIGDASDDNARDLLTPSGRKEFGDRHVRVVDTVPDYAVTRVHEQSTHVLVADNPGSIVGRREITQRGKAGMRGICL